MNAGNPVLIPELRKSFINEIGNGPMLEYVVLIESKVAFVMLNFKMLPYSTIPVKLTKKSLISIESILSLPVVELVKLVSTQKSISTSTRHEIVLSFSLILN